MEPSQLLAAYQPLPFPLPLWLMQILLVAGLFLHVLPMNVIFGGGFLCAALFAAGKNDPKSFQFRAAKALAVGLPIFISFAITQGIVPLLFVQLIYGPAFYTSSIMMAVPWLAIVFIVLTSYYISYAVIYRVLKKEHNASTSSKAATLLVLMGIGFAVVGYLFVSNMTLMLTPEKWASMYQANPNGLHLNTDEPQLWPRYLHFFVASIAVAGMTLGCFGLYMLKKESEFARWMIKTGSKVYLISTIVQIPVGLWFLKAIPPQCAAQFLGADPIATGVFFLAILLTVVAIACTAVACASGGKGPFLAGLTCNALLILSMVVTRHQLRSFLLDKLLKADTVAVQTQWDLLAVFLVSTVALILYLVWLGKLVWKSYDQPQQVAEEKQLVLP
jgi:hypothetical protein